MSNVYFQPDNRHIVIAESCSDIHDAERQVDRFLDTISEQDEAGAHYQRIAISGTERDGKYYFDVVVVH
ncbi:MAG: hypothetical protein JST68_08445 [Bacteroidetes bacterium]|nr:hypothetical protein [Bacteroidota bacterium]